MRRIGLAVLTLAGPLLAASAPAQDASPEDVGRQLVENLLARDGYMRYGEHGLHYSEACAAVGALRFARRIGDDTLVERIAERYAVLLEPGNDLVSRRPHVDMAVIGIVPLEVYRATGDEKDLALGLSLADAQWAEPLESGLTPQTRWWIDDMYMVGMLQSQAYRATGRDEYADRAALQVRAYLERLQEPNGLFFHGPEAPFHWGRGNGWVASAMAEVLDALPDVHPARAEIVAGYRRMMEALLPHQDDDGMWRQLVDGPDSWPESSSTAMFAYAMERGVASGLLDANAYRPRVERAWAALVGLLDDEANLKEICVGTGQSGDRQFYLDRPRHAGDFHGQAPLLWLADALLARGGPGQR